MNAPAAHDHPAEPAACENCGTPLHGHYCHQCGQSVINPVRHAGHALEEVFESFWHLDGRVFRTLRDLLVPGRAAIAYLAGHRTRYIAPLRMFVILTLLTFFVGKLTVHLDQDAVQLGAREAAFGRLQTVAAVERERDRLLVDVEKAEAEAANVPGVNAGLVAARIRIEGEAASRIVELNEAKAAPSADTARTGTAAMSAATTSAATTETAAATRGAEESLNADAPRAARTPDEEASWRRNGFTFNDRPWDAKTNPVKVAWLPGFANAWLNARVGRAQDNIERMAGNPDLWLQAFMGALPTALFVLMPVFALLLKVFYIGTRRLYLEHLVVALYSHAFLLLVLLALFLINALQNVLVPGAVIALTLVEIALYAWMPIYLLLMQKRVYAQAWWLTAPKYLVLGAVYFPLVTFAIVYAVFAGLAA